MTSYNLKRKLNDLALSYKFPRQAHNLENRINRSKDREDIHEIIKHLQAEFEKHGITAEVYLGSRACGAIMITGNSRKRLKLPWRF